MYGLPDIECNVYRPSSASSTVPKWAQFYFDFTTEDLKVTELDNKEIQDEDEAEAKEYVHMAQRTIIPLKEKSRRIPFPRPDFFVSSVSGFVFGP